MSDKAQVGQATTPEAKLTQVRSLLDSIWRGSGNAGRWLDANGHECDEEDAGATWEPYSQEEQGDWLESVASQARQALDLLASPEISAVTAPAASDLRSVEVLQELLVIAKTDEWGLGSGPLDDALADAKEIVQEALGDEYVIFCQDEYDQDDEGIGFWSNDDGWTSLDDATFYRDRARADVALPIMSGSEVRWMLLSEAEALVNAPGAKP